MNDLRHDPEAQPKPSEAFTDLRKQFGAYFDAIPDVDAWCKAVRRGDDPDISDELAVFATPPPVQTVYVDLRTADQRHADEIAALRAEIDDIKATLHKMVQAAHDLNKAIYLQGEIIALLSRRDAQVRTDLRGLGINLPLPRDYDGGAASRTP